MSSPTAGTIVFGFIAIVAQSDGTSIASSILCMACWLNKSLEELKDLKTVS